ncbi:Protein CBG23579 [Caenorhabditis briggsae]|uniref:Protein CBG23579 n=2 Tax=Caenorhabditis briggsae TaxID=6238 RepID=A8WIV7_CAEBR|nr:Protein CBG23579 [Caenorhabditis briggsae]CAP20400.1 Protein CBG23579 [Caenorhabditis briggsae]
MPEFYRCKYQKNSLLNWKMGQHKHHGFIFKLLHADPEISEIFHSPHICLDLIPFMIYSLNKQKRWEAELNEDFLEILQKINEHFEVSVFQRISVYPWVTDFNLIGPHYCTALNSSKIRNSFEISKICNYKEQKFGGAGRFYGSDTKKISRTPTKMEMISYNFVEEPKNWKKVFGKYFRKFKWDRHNDSYIRKCQFDPKSMKLDFQEFKDEQYFGDDDEEAENAEISEKNLKFYNFIDHFVERPRRRKKNRNFRDFEILS